MNAWLREHLICPRDREQVDLSGHELVCPRGHRYPYVDGVPIMLLSELQPTHAAHSQTLEQLKRTPDEEPAPSTGGGDSRAVDPYVQQMVAQTSGQLYKPLADKLPLGLTILYTQH